MGGLPIGKLFGISVRIHISWFIIFALVTWALAANYFPAAYPHWETWVIALISLATSLLFFGSVLAHEMVHSLVARHYGISVPSITLFILGGIAHIAEEPRLPKIEFNIALAGPATSIGLGVFFGLLWIFLPAGAEVVVAVSFWLAWVNLLLGVFNLIPGFPMDGGRVLRSILWWRTGDIRRATRAASNIGQVIGFLFIAGGIYLIFFQTDMWINGIWIALIGWFIRSAAVQSYRQMGFTEALKGHRVSELMSTDCQQVDGDVSIDELVRRYLFSSGRRCFAVPSSSGIAGLISLADIQAVPRSSWGVTRVKDVMVPLEKMETVGPDDDLSRAFNIVTGQNVSQVPVMENQTFRGIITRENLLAYVSLRQRVSQ